MAKSLLVSDRYYDEAIDRYPTRAELISASVEIKACRYVFDFQKVESLVAEKRALDRGGPVPWWKVILLIVCIVALPLIALICFVIRHVL